MLASPHAKPTGGSWADDLSDEEVEWLEYILPPDAEECRTESVDAEDDKETRNVEVDGQSTEEQEPTATRFSDIVDNAPFLLHNLDSLNGNEPYKQIQIASGGSVILRSSTSRQQSRSEVEVNNNDTARDQPACVAGQPHQEDGRHEQALSQHEVRDEPLPDAGGADDLHQEDRRHEQALPQHEGVHHQDTGDGQEVNNNIEGRSPKSRKKYSAPSAGGQKRALLLACADNVPENRSVLNSFLEALEIWTIEEEMIIVGDCKIINLLMGKYLD